MSKPRKLNKRMYDGGDNGGLDYGFQVMDQHRKGSIGSVNRIFGFYIEFFQASMWDNEFRDRIPSVQMFRLPRQSCSGQLWRSPRSPTAPTGNVLLSDSPTGRSSLPMCLALATTFRFLTWNEYLKYLINYFFQEHNVVLIRSGRLQDVPNVSTKCVRGKYDLPHVVKKS